MQAPTTADLFTYPALRPGVEVQEEEDRIALIYRSQSCDIEVDPSSKDSVLALFKSIKSSVKSTEQLRLEYPTISESIAPLLEELDRLGLVTEGRFDRPAGARSGADLNASLRDLANRAMRRRCKSSLFNLMTAGTVTQAILVGYALEYYYLVRSAPGLIAPAMAHADTRASQRLIQRFLVSELDHDLMLAESLASIGIDAAKLDHMQPLPSTFALCSALGVFAKQHLLSFKSILFLFEIPSVDFNAAFVDNCLRLGLPEKFWKPILRHAHINDELDHDDITAELLSGITAISAEECLVVEKNLVLTIETMALQDEEIIEYYGRSNALAPRVFG